MNVKLANGGKAEGLFYTAHPIFGSVIAKDFTFEEDQDDMNEKGSHLLELEEFVYFSVENLEKPPTIEEINSFIKPVLNEKDNKKNKEVLKIDGEITTKKGVNLKKDLVKLSYFLKNINIFVLDGKKKSLIKIISYH